MCAVHSLKRFTRIPITLSSSLLPFTPIRSFYSVKLYAVCVYFVWLWVFEYTIVGIAGKNGSVKKLCASHSKNLRFVGHWKQRVRCTHTHQLPNIIIQSEWKRERAAKGLKRMLGEKNEKFSQFVEKRSQVLKIRIVVVWSVGLLSCHRVCLCLWKLSY